MRVYVFPLLVAFVASFQLPTRSGTQSMTQLNGLFDGFIKSMEAGYVGEDSAFQKQKAADEKKREEQRNRFQQRKSQGFTELKDVAGKKSFAKPKFEEDEPEQPKSEKKLFGLF